MQVRTTVCCFLQVSVFVTIAECVILVTIECYSVTIENTKCVVLLLQNFYITFRQGFDLASLLILSF